MPQRIKDIIDHAKMRFDGWLNRYHPWQGDNHHTAERNLSFQFAQSFLEIYPDGIVFLETPVKNVEGTRSDNHLDAYLHSAEFDILVECKNFCNRGHVESVLTDIKRIYAGFVEIQGRHFPKGRSPNPIYGLVLAESWQLNHTLWWNGGRLKDWPERETVFPRGWEFGYVDVHELGPKKEEALFWLYGVSKMPLSESIF